MVGVGGRCGWGILWEVCVGGVCCGWYVWVGYILGRCGWVMLWIRLVIGVGVVCCG